MKKSDIQKQVEEFVCIHNAYNRTRNNARCDGIWVCMLDGIHVNEGIELFAGAVDKTITVHPMNLEDFKYEFSFVYKNVRFYQLSDKEELPEVVWDAD